MDKKDDCMGDASAICPVLDAMQVIGGKWKILIIYQLQEGSLRFGELKKRLPAITQKMLTQQLRELEKDKLVTRKVYPVVPPRVDYSLTDLSKDLSEVFEPLNNWGKKLLAQRQQ